MSCPHVPEMCEEGWKGGGGRGGRRGGPGGGAPGAPAPAKSSHDNQSPEAPTRPYRASAEKLPSLQLLTETHNISPALVRSYLHSDKTDTVPLSCITY